MWIIRVFHFEKNVFEFHMNLPVYDGPTKSEHWNNIACSINTCTACIYNWYIALLFKEIIFRFLSLNPRMLEQAPFIWTSLIFYWEKWMYKYVHWRSVPLNAEFKLHQIVKCMDPFRRNALFYISATIENWKVLFGVVFYFRFLWDAIHT